MAELQISDLHPIQNTGFEISFPWACCCLKQIKEMNKEAQ